MEIYEEKNSLFHHCLFYVLDVQRVDLILQYHKKKFDPQNLCRVFTKI